METKQIQGAGELRFIVYNRAVHPELFDIWHDHRIVQAGYQAQVWVTGLSHVVGFHRGNATVTELIAPAGTMLPQRGQLVCLGMRGERDQEFVHDEGIRYISSFQVERLSPRVYQKVHAELADRDGADAMTVLFPQWATSAIVPLTTIDVEAKIGHLHLFSYHLFPDELTIVKSQSIFELT